MRQHEAESNIQIKKGNMNTTTKVQEIWRSVKGYEKFYEVSSLGRIKSLNRYVNNNGTLQLRPERILKLRTDKDGYFDVMLCVNKKTKRFKVHRLVADAFIDNTKNHPQVNHKNENKKDNTLNNLEWCTSDYNLSYNNGRKKRAKSRINNHKMKVCPCFDAKEEYKNL